MHPKDIIIKLNSTLIAEVSFRWDLDSIDKKKIEADWTVLTKGMTEQECREAQDKELVEFKVRVNEISFYRKPTKTNEQILGLSFEGYVLLNKKINEVTSEVYKMTFSDYWS